eukprot:COSAG02_NODE_1103_length_14561_cov_2.692435_2_plen_517_part_00
MQPGGWAQHICIEPTVRVSVELLPGAEWRGRQRITIPPPAIAEADIHPMLHAPPPTPPSLLAEVQGVLVDTFSAAVNWRAYIASELEQVFSHRLETGHHAVLELPQISSADQVLPPNLGTDSLPAPDSTNTPVEVTGNGVDWESLASQWREDNLEDSTVFADGDGLTNGTMTRRRGLDRIVQYLRPAIKVGEEPQQEELDRLRRAWLRIPAWDDVPAGLSAIRSAYVVAAVDPGTTLWDLTALTKHSQMLAIARTSPGHSPPRTPSRGSTPPVGFGAADWGGGSRPHTPGSPNVGEQRLGSPIVSHRRPGSRQRRRPTSRDGRPSSHEGSFNFSLGGGRGGSSAFFNSMETGLQWDMTLPPLGSLEDSATFDRTATLLGHLPSSLLLVSSNPHALLTAQRAGWRTAYVSRPGTADHPRLRPDVAHVAHKKSTGDLPAGPQSVGHQYAEASLRKERVFASTYDAESKFSGRQSDQVSDAPTSAEEEVWDGSMFDVSAIDLGTLAAQLVPPHTRRWRP